MLALLAVLSALPLVRSASTATTTTTTLCPGQYYCDKFVFTSDMLANIPTATTVADHLRISPVLDTPANGGMLECGDVIQELCCPAMWHIAGQGNTGPFSMCFMGNDRDPYYEGFMKEARYVPLGCGGDSAVFNLPYEMRALQIDQTGMRYEQCDTSVEGERCNSKCSNSSASMEEDSSMMIIAMAGGGAFMLIIFAIFWYH